MTERKKQSVQPIHGFPPIARRDARVLILGSTPSVASLERQQYYGHARNAFWPIMCDLFHLDPTSTYARRKLNLRRNGVAVWDVMALCKREGSLDSAIQSDSIVANDFETFFATKPNIRSVFFNGTKAESTFHRYVAPFLNGSQHSLCYRRLPSTSPAMASLNYSAKLNEWQVVKLAAEGKINAR